MNTFQLRIERERRGKSIHWIECILVDDEVIGGGCAVDYLQLAQTTANSGEFWPFTCGCGEPGCAGILEPVTIERVGTTVSWHLIDPSPRRHFTFAVTPYRNAIHNALDHAQQIITGKHSSFPIGPRGFGRSQLQEALTISQHALL